MPRRLLLAGLLFLAPLPAARAEEEIPAVERERRIEETIRRLRAPSPIFLGDPERIRTLVQELMSARSPRADSVLREVLLDTGAHENLVEQVAVAALFDPDHRFVAEIVDRLRIDAQGALDRRVSPLWQRADGTTVRKVGEIALDTSRSLALRRTATRILGLTGDGSTLDVLVALWGGPDRELRDEARASFDAVLPVGLASATEARTFLDAMRRDDVPFAEILRRALRDRARAAQQTVPAETAEAYRRLADELLPTATADQVLRLFLQGSPLADVRSAAAKRLRAMQFDADGRLRAARGLFEALRRESDPGVEMEVLRALAVLAPAARGSVGHEDMQALLSRVDPLSGQASGRASPERRLIVARLLGELRDPRAIEPLESAFDALAGSDYDARMAILDALQSIPPVTDIAPWLARHAAVEQDVRITRKLVALLARSRSDGAVAAFRSLLATHADANVRLDAARALGTIWAGSSSEAARDALLGEGLADRDPAVRRTCAAALGFAGPGDEVLVPRLRETVRADLDESVRLAAAKSILDLGSASTTATLAGLLPERPEIWPLWRDHVLEGLGTRDATPDRLLATADALAAAKDGVRAAEILRNASEEQSSPWKDASGRSRVRERLVNLLLDEGSPGEAEQWARRLLETPDRDEIAALRWDLLLARAQVNSGERARVADAETRLVALRSNPKLAVPLSLHAAVVLGDCRLRLDDPAGALAALEGDFALAADPVRILRDTLVERAKTRVAEDRKLVFGLVETLDGPDAEASARAASELRALGARAAVVVDGALAHADDAGMLRRWVRAAAAVTGTEAESVAADLSRERITEVAGRTREGLRKVPRFVPVTPKSR